MDFARFYDDHFDAVYRYVSFRVSHNRAVAEDLTADIFVSALAAFETFDPNLGAKAWIMTIARNKVINHWRDKKVTVDVDDVAMSLVGEDGRQASEVSDDLRYLHAALQALKPEDRSLIEHKYLLGYRYHEMAKASGKHPSSLRVDTFRAMKKLKALMRLHV